VIYQQFYVMKKNIQDLRLLPNYFRKIAFSLLVISIAGLIVLKSLALSNELIKEISINGILISLLLFAISKDKFENEFAVQSRLQSYAYAFVFGAILVIVNPYTNLLFDGTYVANYNSHTLLFSMLIFYFIMYFNLKRRRRNFQ